MTRITGYKYDAVIGVKGNSFMHPDDVEDTRKALKTQLKVTGKGIALIRRLRHRKGEYFWVTICRDGVISGFRIEYVYR